MFYMIDLEHVTKLYRTVIGVNDMTLRLEPGAYGLLGPNGSGKTTFLNLITGQLRPTIGSVRLFGENPRNNPWILSRIGVCPGDEAMYSNVSGLEWVQFQMELHGMKPAEASQRAHAALEQVGMTDAMHRMIRTYSRGMRQRTKMAQAIAHDPELLILDEPYNGLDPIARHELTELLQSWIRRGKSLILASHILYEVESISHSFLLIWGGRLLASGTSEEVRTLLNEISFEVRIRCDRPRELGQRLLASEVADRVELDGSHTLVATGPHMHRLFQLLPEWVHESGIRVDELRSDDESLQSLFDTLLKMQRGGEV